MKLWKKPKPKPKKPVPKPRTATQTKPKPSAMVTSPRKSTTDIPKKVPTIDEPEPKPKRLDSEKEFLRIFKLLTYRHRAWEIWSDFIVMSACALSNPLDKDHYEERERRYLKIILKYNKEEQNKFPELLALVVMALDENPEQDFLGKIFMQLDMGDDGYGQIFTPYHVCELMAKILIDAHLTEQIQEKGFVSINDSCCGAGATLIAGVNEARKILSKLEMNFQNHIFVTAQDIDEIAALMCYIQLSLLGVAACIKVGNTLTEPMCDTDTKENYWYTPMYFSDIWKMRRMVQCFESMKGEP